MKYKKSAIILAMLVVVLLLVSGVFLSFIKISPTHFSVQVGTNDTIEHQQSFFWNPDSLQSRTVSAVSQNGDMTYRTISNNAQAIVNLRHRLRNVSFVELELEIEPTDADLEIALPCDMCEDDAYTMPLYFGGMEEYTSKKKLKEGYYIYTDADVSGVQSVQDVADMNPSGKPPIVFIDPLIADSTVIARTNDITADSSKMHKFNGKFDTPHTFYIQARKGNLQLEFLKENTNSNEASDDLLVTIKDVSSAYRDIQQAKGDSEVFDESDVSSKQRIHMDFAIPADGVYMLSFATADRSVNAVKVHSLSLNTNKIVFTDATISGASSVFKVLHETQPVSIAVKKRHSNDLIVTEDNGTEVLRLATNDMYLNDAVHDLDLEKGTYSISSFPKYTVSGALFSFKEHNVFNPFGVVTTTLPSNAQALITPVDITTEGERITVRRTEALPTELLKKDTSSNIQLTFISKYSKYYSAGVQEAIDSYSLVATACNMALYSRFTGSGSSPDVDCNADDIGKEVGQAFAQFIPDQYAINSLTQRVDIHDFTSYTKPTIDSTDHDIELDIKGGGLFAFYHGGDIRMALRSRDLNASSGGDDDDLFVSVRDEDGRLVYSETIKGDTIVSKTGLPSEVRENVINIPEAAEGLYYLIIQDENGQVNPDAFLESVRINTNAFIAIETGELMQSDDDYIYFTTDKPRDLLITARDRSNTISFQLNDNRIETGVKRRFIYRIDSGTYKMRVDTGSVIIGVPFAFAPDQFFDLQQYNEGDDYIVIDRVQQANISLYRFEMTYQ